ncbi:hypothetical protein J41TS4_26070 [Paenibacillus apis]|uniref:Uncharacterized protein n=1 Tax=Paenibacillus apis TaxID=1792174 RepID=A0A920CMM4_9BACL|nr:hypothetical protein J41TS4_26070 [Paenibacillus apis]
MCFRAEFTKSGLNSLENINPLYYYKFVPRLENDGKWRISGRNMPILSASTYNLRQNGNKVYQNEFQIY